MSLRDDMGAAFDAAGFTYGEEISHEWITSAAGLEYPKLQDIKTQGQLKRAVDRYQLAKMAAIEALRDYALVERRMYLQSINGTGYRIVMPGEQTDAALRYGMKQVLRGFERTRAGVSNVNTHLLTHEERARNASVQAKIAGLQFFVSSRVRRISDGN